MALDRQLSTSMPDTVTIHPYSAFNNYGERSYGSSRTASAYVERPVTLDDSGMVEEQEDDHFFSCIKTNACDKKQISRGTLPDLSASERSI